MAWSPLGLTEGDFSHDTVVFTAPTGYIYRPSLTTDAVTWSEYYCYLAFSADDGNGNDIYFARSTDQGTTWEAPYVLASITVSDRGYYTPQVAVGYGGWVHVAWYLGFGLEHEFDNTIRYRRATSYANGGLAGWETMQSLTSHTDGVDMNSTRLAASWVSDDVMMAFMRRVRLGGGAYENAGHMTLSSDDAGAGWSGPTVIGSGFDWLGDLLHQEVNDRWLLGVNRSGGWEFTWAPTSSPAAWSDAVDFADVYRATGEPSLALDPSHGGRICVVGGDRNPDDSFTYYFDAEWRADPGYPNLESGFPLGLWATPISPPALADVDGDGDLEIVFSDAQRRIQVIDHDGGSPPGWPVDVGVDLSDGPVAVGDLNGDGLPTLVVGGTDGKAYAFDHEGNLLSGWPSAITGTDSDVYVSIGAVGPPYPRSIVCAGGNYITLRNSRGVAPPGTVGWSPPGTYAAPACIGDIDNDGVAEIVSGIGTRVFAFAMGELTLEFNVFLPAAVSDALTLGDLDLDGDLEILCPTVTGVLYALDHTGAQLGGEWPCDTGVAHELTSAAIAQLIWMPEPELAFANRDWRLYQALGDGSLHASFPQLTSLGWYLWGAPIVGSVGRTSASIVIGDRGDRGWSYTNTGFLEAGWPKDLFDQVNLSPAMGDIDLDGSNEIVFLTDTQLLVVDMNNPPLDAAHTWAMYGHDPQRTGCADCVEDMATAVPAGGITRVSFAGPAPNPVAGFAEFAFAVPVRAAASLEIVDLRGRRVFTVFREEMDPGSRVVAWHGEDASGRRVASGTYFARLRVRGPGLDETLSRKVSVIR